MSSLNLHPYYHTAAPAVASTQRNIMASPPPPTLSQRKITVSKHSPPTAVHVFDVNGKELVSLQSSGERSKSFPTRGTIGDIRVTVQGETRSCNLMGHGWLDITDNIGITTRMRGREPVCSLEDVSTTRTPPDISAQLQGNRCQYMTNPRGEGGLVCK